MTPALFAVLAASVALVVMLLVDLAVPFGGLRRWLLRAPHVETHDEVYGPWWVVDEEGERAGGDYDRPSLAAAQLTAGQRVRAWGGSLISCPYCCGAWISAGGLGLASIHYGLGVLWYWPSLWFSSSVLVVTARAIGDR